jgi:hypothetical protein
MISEVHNLAELFGFVLAQTIIRPPNIARRKTRFVALAFR